MSRKERAEVNHARSARQSDGGENSSRDGVVRSNVGLGVRDEYSLNNQQPILKQCLPDKETVSCVLLTDRLTAESAEWFSQVREIVDELVIFVDTQLAGEETHAFARQLTRQVHEVKGQGYVEAHLEQMAQACSGQWILRLDSDEQLTRGWMNGAWRDLLRGDATHFLCPRRWIHPGGGFIDSAPWWPDWQIRLFRNEPSRLTFPEEIHEPTIVTGAGRRLFHLGIDHHVLRTTRAQREEKVQHYTKLRPGKPLGHYYLFEDFGLTPAPLVELTETLVADPAELVA